jgi:superfamily II DNA or RNA helicase
MKEHQFQTQTPDIEGNLKLRTPQRQGFSAIELHYSDGHAEREVGVILPVGCGKSGLISITPFALQARRALVIAPGRDIADQLLRDFDPTSSQFFYAKCSVLPAPPYPECAELRHANRGDLDEADVVITNIHQLQGEANKWLAELPADFFDVILFDEGHHNVADSWNLLRKSFPRAKIINFSATPGRADGQLMEGKIIYSFPVSAAIAAGYVKSLKAVVLNPATLKYVRREDGNEIEVSLDEVIRLGEQDADFRRSIVSSEHSLATIVNCSIQQLKDLRTKTGDNRLKIIASALNYEHCIQITSAYRERGLRAAYVHSREEGKDNKKILQQLENNELDVIVQVRKLAEGFDHKYLSVAAVCSVFSNLSPFIQFVGRIMRAIEQEKPGHVLNQGVVVFHAGANIKERWDDFQRYSTADQEYFAQLLPLEEINFADGDEAILEPVLSGPYENPVEIRHQAEVLMQEIPLLKEDAEAARAIAYLKERGYSPDEVKQAMLIEIPTTKQRHRLASQKELDDLVKHRVGKLLIARKINPKGRELDNQKPPRENFVLLKSGVDKKIYSMFERGPGQRGDFTQAQLDAAEEKLQGILMEVAGEVLDG